MKRWLVVTREYGIHEIIADGQGPWIPERDVVEVEAETKADARVVGVQLLRRQHSRALEDGCPFTDLEVFEVLRDA